MSARIRTRKSLRDLQLGESFTFDGDAQVYRATDVWESVSSFDSDAIRTQRLEFVDAAGRHRSRDINDTEVTIGYTNRRAKRARCKLRRAARLHAAKVRSEPGNRLDASLNAFYSCPEGMDALRFGASVFFGQAYNDTTLSQRTWWKQLTFGLRAVQVQP